MCFPYVFFSGFSPLYSLSSKLDFLCFVFLFSVFIFFYNYDMHFKFVLLSMFLCCVFMCGFFFFCFFVVVYSGFVYLKRYQILHSHNLHQNCTVLVCCCVYFFFLWFGCMSILLSFFCLHMSMRCPCDVSRDVFSNFLHKEKIMSITHL